MRTRWFGPLSILIYGQLSICEIDVSQIVRNLYGSDFLLHIGTLVQGVSLSVYYTLVEFLNFCTRVESVRIVRCVTTNGTCFDSVSVLKEIRSRISDSLNHIRGCNSSSRIPRRKRLILG
jgi:hypothetical protein